MLKYLIPFLTSFILAIFFICFSFLFFKKESATERDSGRHIHKGRNVFRWGGLVMILVFNLTVLLNKDLYISTELWGMMMASLLILFVGVWDDIRELSWKIQLPFQALAAGIVFLFGLRIKYLADPFFGGIIHLDSGWFLGISFFVGLVWILILMNAINWLDGIDGLSGGISCIAFLTIFFLSLKAEVNQPPMAILAIILTGGVLGFLIFNFYPAKIMAGTAGSIFLGFSLATLAIFSGTKIATTLLVLFVPIIDFLWVIYERWKRGRSIFVPDKNHLHFKLLELGWSQKKITLNFCAITGIVAIIALNTRALGKSVTLLLFGAVLIIILIAINRILKVSKNLTFEDSKKRPEKKSNRVKALIIVAVSIIILLGAVFFSKKINDFRKNNNGIGEIKLGQENFSIEIANTQEKIEKGLSDRENFCEKCAMLFIFKDSRKQTFWMKNMKFDLDIIWIRGNEIVGISSNVSHENGENEVISSPGNIDKVIEIRAGMSEKLNLKIGDIIKI